MKDVVVSSINVLSKHIWIVVEDLVQFGVKSNFCVDNLSPRHFYNDLVLANVLHCHRARKSVFAFAKHDRVLHFRMSHSYFAVVLKVLLPFCFFFLRCFFFKPKLANFVFFVGLSKSLSVVVELKE